jgi:isoquinoline 1-oxidoreductase subunit alpha
VLGRLKQNQAVGVHSLAILDSRTGIQQDQLSVAGGISILRDSASNVEVLTMLSLQVNRKTYNLDVEPDTPLLWVIRDSIGLTGTKFGCGMALCGACTVHLNGKPVRSCVTRAAQAVGQEITTIEGLSADAQHPAQIAWREGDVPECGYCQSGQIMAAAALLAKNPNPTDADIQREITNLCRCGTYLRIRQAVHRAAELAASKR